MDVVRHHHERVQAVPMKSGLAIVQSLNDRPRQYRLTQEYRAAGGAVQESIHGHKRAAGRKALRRKSAIGRQAAVQPERDEHGPPNDIPVGKAALVFSHRS
jgi:hypothetical protein